VESFAAVIEVVSMKVFLDVGCHSGDAIDALLEPSYGFEKIFFKYGFERVYCFEPVAELHRALAKKYLDPRITLYEMGLWEETCEKPIFSPGTQGGSIFADKVNVDPLRSEVCKFVRASDWFREHLTDADEVYVKLNCEGCEADIIEDLLDADEYGKIASLLVAFDVKKIPSQRHREVEIKRRLKERGYENYFDLDTLFDGSLQATIQEWLSMAGAERRSSLAYRFRHALFSCQIFAARAARFARRLLRGE
jgi:FkbM family methyltransferase